MTCEPVKSNENIDQLKRLGPYTHEFKKDLMDVDSYLKHFFEKKHLCTWALINDSCKKGCGREAYLIQREHMLGPDHIKRMVIALEADISVILWSTEDIEKTFT